MLVQILAACTSLTDTSPYVLPVMDLIFLCAQGYLLAPLSGHACLPSLRRSPIPFILHSVLLCLLLLNPGRLYSINLLDSIPLSITLCLALRSTLVPCHRYSDFKNASVHLAEHEGWDSHRKTTVTYNGSCAEAGRMNSEPKKQANCLTMNVDTRHRL